MSPRVSLVAVREDLGSFGVVVCVLIMIASCMGNVFEEVLPSDYHEVFAIKHRLLELGAMNAVMSGSGPAVFGIFREQETAEQARQALQMHYAQTYLATPVRKFR